MDVHYKNEEYYLFYTFLILFLILEYRILDLDEFYYVLNIINILEMCLRDLMIELYT